MNQDERRRLNAIIARLRRLVPPEVYGEFAPVMDPELDAAEQRLGLQFPSAYRELMKVTGRLSWPVALDSPELLERGSSGPWPERFTQFGSDVGELQYLFEWTGGLAREADVVVWDLEEGAEQDVEPTSFLDWLEDAVDEAWTYERQQRCEVVQGMLDALPVHVFGPPAEAEGVQRLVRLAKAEGGLLPDEYAWFQTRYGAGSWPVEWLSCEDAEALCHELRAEGKRKLLPIARESGAALYAFELPGQDASDLTDLPVICIPDGANEPLLPGRFTDFIEWLGAAITRGAQRDAARRVTAGPAQSKAPTIRRKGRT